MKGVFTMSEVEVWTVAVGNLPMLPKFLMPKKVTEAVELIKTLEGLIGVSPCYPKGTLLLFDTENNAKGARNVLRFHDVQTGTNICKVFVDKSYLEGGRNARNDEAKHKLSDG